MATFSQSSVFTKAVVALGLAIGLTSCREAKMSLCVDNLRNIDVFKFDWANNESKGTNDVPNWEDLRPYFPARWSNNIPICPAGGTYTIDSVSKAPTCSIGGPSHSVGY